MFPQSSFISTEIFGDDFEPFCNSDRYKYIAFIERESKRSRKHTHIYVMYKPIHIY